MVRRIVTRDVEGVGALLSDGPAPEYDMGGGARVFEIWLAPHDDGTYPADQSWALNPPQQGAVFRIAEFPPVSGDEPPFMHKTPTIDFGVVIEGELCLILDDREVVLQPGDTFVQRQANHAWVNRSDKRVRMAVVLMDGAY